MRILGGVRKLMCSLIISHDGGVMENEDHLSVSEYLVRCSRLSHLLFFLFCHKKTKFCAAQNYRNWQNTVKNMFTTVTLGETHVMGNFCFFPKHKQTPRATVWYSPIHDPRKCELWLPWFARQVGGCSPNPMDLFTASRVGYVCAQTDKFHR